MATISKPVLLSTVITILFLVIVFVGWSNYRLFEARFTTQLTLDEAELLAEGTSIFSRELGHIKNTTLFLRNSIDSLSTTRDHISDVVWFEPDITQVFSQFAKTSPFISQVRWIDPTGKELARVNSHNGEIVIVPSDQLQDKSERYYVHQNNFIVGDNVYISPVDLNIENNQIVTPLEPTLRGVVPLSHHRKGILVVNYNLTKLFDQLRSLSNDRLFLDLVSTNGEWMVSQTPEQEWKNTLNNHPTDNYFNTLYPEVWAAITQGTGMTSVLFQGQMWSANKVVVENEGVAIETEQVSCLYFIARSRLHILAEYQAYLQKLIIIIGSVAFFGLTFVLWWLIDAVYKRRALMVALEQEKSQLKVVNNDLYKANYQLVELQNELVEASKLSALGMMVAGLAHEMNTPLGGVRMALSSLGVLVNREVETLPEKSKETMLNSINIADKNLTRAVNLVASFKRITADASGQDIELFSFNDVLKDILIVYKSLLKRQPGMLLIQECEPHIEMQGFPGILFQVMQNLIDNSLQHGFKDMNRGTIKIIARKSGDNLELIIEDDGKGVSSEVVDRLFEPFVTTGRATKHTGLGLHLVHQWVYKLMGGRIEVTSKEEEGARFTVYIPLQLARVQPS